MKVLLIADTPDQTAVVQAGQPPTHMGAWLIDVPVGTDPLKAATDWVATQTFQVGTVMRVLTDLTPIQTFALHSQWVSA